VASPLANRKYLYTTNYSKFLGFIGGSGVSPANGFPVYPDDIVQMRLGPSAQIYFVGENNKIVDFRNLELS
jgi:hypothetical protein